MKKSFFSALVVAGLVLTGCSSISAGTITNKVYEPGHYYSTMVCTPVGKVTVCNPINQYDDEDWRFDIREGDKDGFVYVTEDTFNQYEVGDYFGE